MKDHSKFSDLLDAVEQRPAEFESMVRNQPSLLEFTGPLGETLLHYLAIEDRFAAVKTLARLGAKVDPVNEFGNTPLMECAMIDRRQMVLLLLELGADPNFKSPRDRRTPLHHAGESGREDIYQLLISKGADPSAKNDLGETPQDMLEFGRKLSKPGANTHRPSSEDDR